MSAGGNVISRNDELCIADSPDCDASLAVLSWLNGVDRRQNSLRFGNGAKIFRDEVQGFGGVKSPGDQQHGIIGLVVLVIEGLEAVYRHVLDIAPGADCVFGVAVPIVGGSEHSLERNAERRVLPEFQLVSNYGHLAVQILPGDERIDHPVGFKIERPFEISVACSKGFEVVRSIEGCGAVWARAVLGKLLGYVDMFWRSFEHEVFKKVSHARLSVVFMTRTD